MMELARTQDGRVDLAELAREIARLEGGAVNLPGPQIQEVLSCLGRVLAGAGLVAAAEVMSRLMERGAERLEMGAEKEIPPGPPFSKGGDLAAPERLTGDFPAGHDPDIDPTTHQDMDGICEAWSGSPTGDEGAEGQG